MQSSSICDYKKLLHSPQEDFWLKAEVQQRHANFLLQRNTHAVKQHILQEAAAFSSRGLLAEG